MKQADYDHYMNLISEGKLNEATDFRRKIMPKYIYKFYPLYSKTGRGKLDIRTFDTLSNNCIWCSKIDYFNDPYEGIGHYYGFDKEVETRLAGFLRIASFADDAAQNISMWAYYANNHKGFCVKYEVIDNRYLYDVTYIEQRQSQANFINGNITQALCVITDWEPGAIVFQAEDGEIPKLRIIFPEEYFEFMKEVEPVFDVTYPKFSVD